MRATATYVWFLAGAYLMTSLLEEHKYIWTRRKFGPDKTFPCFEAFWKFFSPKAMIKCTIVEIKPSQGPCVKKKWVSFSIFLHFFHVCGHFFLDTGPDKIQGPTIWGGTCLINRKSEKRWKTTENDSWQSSNRLWLLTRDIVSLPFENGVPSSFPSFLRRRRRFLSGDASWWRRNSSATTASHHASTAATASVHSEHFVWLRDKNKNTSYESEPSWFCDILGTWMTSIEHGKAFWLPNTAKCFGRSER